ncbi:MAG: response regulator transcription factor [Bacteroidetes bacterium]|jgi:two-component system, LytTR family, response regulator|nr:response regulator transcription factor [Bacteroidota bacterium]MBT4397879.1 response regulator transcription factor [Bacteroidota bacterium]MBT7463335.1 response regulator transcription factor [Bacteroidota bacterium]
MRVFKAMIIDDELLARRALRSLLADFPHIDIVAESDCVQDAVGKIKEFQPNLLFLDIQMPGKTGFDLLDQIEYQGDVIFVTAYDEFALRAFEINAMDYLMKPVSPKRLQQSISRLDAEIETHEEVKYILNYRDRLFVLRGRSMVFLKISNIVFIEAEGDYSKVFTSDEKHGLVLKSMKEWEERLPERYFCRIHRSYIVNLEWVERVEKEFNYDFTVHLKNYDKSLMMSRRYARKLKERMA